METKPLYEVFWNASGGQAREIIDLVSRSLRYTGKVPEDFVDIFTTREYVKPDGSIRLIVEWA